ncbi:malate dehydrogenase [Candidatus Roizmanbacteria bacterium RIFCSPLOWO2_01_FULL_38_12]|uniref:Malate dehydrogenase n=1 Tax=Candidatus Roizmanbacteria bacterium RIFCSPLOWO2_01_FULL_38_12 TaxID=1802061 RepID=A0A1F7IYB5_9BACT|nr:MAG: malate dehydrogenase [Candidatus Roizmanbacteria bacterium RIFCSPHIGHO2_01_FULL_38_15]OGK34475.1 MAG: malate dehydrogenase [Candidatus Roizmanbacteria bacterium RIFCSPHIGHO2_12_FULL_38_13]OGK48305.1 MAG: malate dehydrogenase [Candidatus Roizmanbacteria bacterium RIFCSPLOWO2_01_FULL_38_12]
MSNSDLQEKALDLHKKHKGKITVKSKIPQSEDETFSLVYTPGVAAASRKIAEDTNSVFDYTIKSNFVAVVSDGTAVLGLGNIGPEAAMPVMEGKALLMSELAGIDAVPLCIKAENADDIIRFVKQCAPTFGAINLEDIAAPRCFEVEDQLQDIGIPVFHDDQHGTAVVVFAALLNACRVLGKKLNNLRVVIVGSGAAGIAVTKLIANAGEANFPQVADIKLVDSKGIVSPSRTDMNSYKLKIAQKINKENKEGDLAFALKGADVVVGLSRPGIITKQMIKSMNPDPIVFAMANPVPEIMPDEAKEVGAAIVATGRSDLPNQINNALGFPGIFRGLLNCRAKRVTTKMKYATAKVLSEYVVSPKADQLLSKIGDREVVKVVADAVSSSYE